MKTASADPIETKRAEAQNVLAQIHEIDGQLEQAVEAYNLANVKLQRIQGELKTNAHHLVIARKSLKNAQTHLVGAPRRAVLGGGDGTSLEVLLGARSIDDLLNRLDAVERVSAQDTRVLREVKSFRAQVRQRRVRLQAGEGRAGAGRRRSRSPAAVDRGPACRAQPAARLDQGSDREPRGSRAPPAGAARRQARARLSRASLQAQDQSVRVADVALRSPGVTGERSRPRRPSRYGGVVGIAMQYLGVPYVWGGASPSGFDCSGFVMYVYSQVGVSLPHHAASQYGVGSPVSRDALEPGDLVFFNGLGHAGIYIGGGQFVHAPHTGDVVKISSLSDSWYAATWVGARRL